MTWTWLSEDPWPLAGAFAVLAVAFLVMLRTTRRARYLAWAGAALGAAGLVVLVEHLWVTDRERIEHVVHDLADAVKAGDFDRIEAHLAPEFEQELGTITRLAMRGAVMGMDFEFVRIAQLDVHAGRHTGMGKADFLGQAQWSERTSTGSPSYNATPPPGIGFSFGFREVDPGDWKVSRIDVTRVPYGGSGRNVSDYLSRFALDPSRPR